jgi:hypothetical protein
MSRAASFIILAASAAAMLTAAGCSGGQIAVGRSDQQLQTRKNGQPTGDGATCSWTETALWDAASKQSPPPSSGPFNLGATFPSLDGCNDCSCTAKGIMCTVRACQNGATPADAGPSCETIANAAADELAQVIANNQACTVDADCTTVWRSTDCFDHCDDALAKSGESAVAATKAQLNANQCKQFLDAGCKLIVPPCAPSVGVRCSSGKCTPF